jgi:hypothetical protein
VWPDERVVRLVSENFLPARLHVRDDAADFKRYRERYASLWTPTILLLHPNGEERHRIEGFLPAEDFLAQLTLGLGHLAFTAERWSEAERWFTQVVEQFPQSEAAAEALYWAGVSRYKGKDDKNALAETARAFEQRYPDSSWAKKASVWRK